MLEAAFSALETDSYHFEMDMEMAVAEGGMTMEIPFTFTGDFQAPDRVQGTMSMSFLGMTIELEFITIGETAYTTNMETGEWEVSTEQVSPFAPEDFTGIDPADIEDLALVGEETLDGTAVYHLTGTVSAQELGDAMGEAQGELQVGYWIGVEDGRLRQNAVEGELSAEGGTIDLIATTVYSDYGQSVTIEPPELPAPPALVSVRPTPATPVLHPQWTSYTQANFANDLLRMEDDLWAATDGGVLRWDLAEGTCVKYTPEHGLASNFVSFIAVDGEGVLWFGTYYHGVSRFDGQAWTTYTTNDGLASDEIRAIAVDGEGALWFATRGGGVSRFDGEEWTTYAGEGGLASDNVYAVTVDNKGVLWFGTDQGVSSYDGEMWKAYTQSDGLASDQVNAVTADGEGVLWFGTDGGVSRFDGETWTTYTGWDGLASDEVNAVAVDGEGVLWFGTDSGVSRFDGETWATYTEQDGLVSNGVYATAVDEDGTLWFGTEHGISHLAQSPEDVTDMGSWTTYRTDDELRQNSGTAVTVTSDGAVWVGALGGGVSRFDGEAWTNYSKEEGLAGESALSAAEGPDGALYFATGGGVCRFDGETWMTYMETADLASGPGVVAWASDRTLWYGTAKGVTSFDGESWTTYTVADGLAANYLLGIAEAPDGALWFATNDGVSRFDGEEWTTYTTADGLAQIRVAALAVAPDGALWFATEGGVSRFDGQTWTTYTTADGLANDDVRAIEVASDGALWFGTAGGVSRFDGQTWSTYTTADGLVNESVWAVAMAPDGALWFSTWGGVSRYMPPEAPVLSYSFRLDREVVDAFWNEDGSLSLAYEFTFTNDAFASPIDFVDVAIPSQDYRLQDISAEVDNHAVHHIAESEFVAGAIELGLGEDAIPPGETGRVSVQIERIQGVLSTDPTDEKYASAVLTPTWFAPEFIHGTTDLTVVFHLPPGVQSDEARWHRAPPGWPAEPTTGQGEQGRITYAWNNASANGHTQYIFGASFPASYVPESSINQPS
jgi:ligand-binding sensor domain-containing protein